MKPFMRTHLWGGQSLPLRQRRRHQSSLIPHLAWAALLWLFHPLAATAAENTVLQPPAAKHFFDIPAYAFDRGNAKTFTQEYADAGPMIAFGGVTPVHAEYSINFPNTAEYVLRLHYTAADERPIELYWDGQLIGRGCRSTTGSWNTSGARWEETCRLAVKKGTHRLKILREGSFPHVVGLRFETETPFPDGWVLSRPKARKLNDPPPAVSDSLYGPVVKLEALRLAILDLIQNFGPRYSHGSRFLERLDTLERELKRASELRNSPLPPPNADQDWQQIQKALADLQQEALLANPLLDFDRLLLVKRRNNAPDLGLPYNWQSNSSLPKQGFDDSICVLSPLRPEGKLTELYRPPKGRFAGDVDLNFDADKMLFSMVGRNERWQVWEIRADGTGLRELTGEQPDVDSYDACYLPDGRIIFTSTAYFVGVPCVYGSSHVANLYQMDANGKNIRQLCFDQEHDWCPTVLNNGRILYTRWEYIDTPHSNTRLLFHMNPDGTGQMEFLGSNSYWPNSFFYARPIPGHPTMVVAVIGGHHDYPRMGELVVFDPARGRNEGAPAVQRIPGHGQKVEPIIKDGLASASWPKFLHPYPLSEKYFLVSCKPTPNSPWGIYLADIFDNLMPICQMPDHALLEPVPFRPTTRPPIIPDKVNLASKDALVEIADIYSGDGLKGIPRGTIKQLRLLTYHFAYQGMGGLLGVVGMDGPWDIKRVLGTVAVNPDGSARFRIPANTPVSIQPLDQEGKAVQLMRSWMTGMPGEVVQCAGCHERQNASASQKINLAQKTPVQDIQPWLGPTRGFSFPREVQPVLDRHCVGCHNGQPGADGVKLCDLRGTEKLKDWSSITPGNGGSHAGKFSVSYAQLHRYVRRPGIESDYHMLEPMEFHADTTQLVQMLKKGHHQVRLDAESWDRLITWIDLNCPYHGTWGEEIDHPGKQADRRRDLLKLYAGVEDDPEAVPATKPGPVIPAPLPAVAPASTEVSPVAGWPFDSQEAQRRQKTAGTKARQVIKLTDSLSLEMALVPPGEFLMGSAQGMPDETPVAKARITKAFWMGVREIDNRLYSQFDPAHDSRIEDKNAYQFGIHGYPMNLPQQPVVRVSWQEAMAFCRWLSEKTGLKFSLPTEIQWEYACRAGSATPYYFGALNSDFSRFANLADAKLSEFASDPYTVDVPLPNPTPYDDWLLKDARFNDGALLTVAPGKYLPNAWGLFDMHGNAAEWTCSDYKPYPLTGEAETLNNSNSTLKVVRGGSWRDLPKHSTASYRLAYLPYQRVYNVGFRVVCETAPEALALKK